jgi:hypothetical protein
MRHVRGSLALAVSLTLAPVVTGCGRGARVESYPDAAAGLFVARLGGKTIVRGAAQATYCRGDSILVVVAMTPHWTAGVALRGAFPVTTARTFSVGNSLGGEGSATAAFRAVTDSVEPALVAAGGTARLEPGPAATGRFDVRVPAPDGRSPPRRVLGAFRTLPTTDTAAACGLMPRTP